MIKNKYFFVKIILTIILSIIYLIINYFITIPLLNSSKYIIENNLTQFIYVDYTVEESNSYFVVSDYYRVYKNGTQIKVNLLMQQQNQSYNILTNKLYKNDEIVLTKKLSQELKVKIGDYITIENPYNHRTENYILINTIEDIQITNTTLDFNVAIIGFNDKYIQFKNDNTTLIINTPNRLYDETILPTKTISSDYIVFRNTIICIIIVLVQLIVTYLILEIYINFDNYSEKFIKKYYLYGGFLTIIKCSIIIKRLILIIILIAPLVILLFIGKNVYCLILLIPILFHEVYDWIKNFNMRRILRCK